jgi:hypothetical protein
MRPKQLYILVNNIIYDSINKWEDMYSTVLKILKVSAHVYLLYKVCVNATFQTDMCSIL